MKVLSYNLRKHRAAMELVHLVTQYDPDVLCLQEADVVALPERLGGLELVDATKGNRLGLAMYVRSNSFRVLRTRTIGLKKSLHDRVLKPAHERVLGAVLREVDSGTEVVIASFHAAPLTARNALRREQMHAAFAELDLLSEGAPTLLVGDFNYPVFKERLAAELRSVGYELIMSNVHTYERMRIFKGFYDFAAARGFDVSNVSTLPQGTSDHLPILVQAEPRAQ